jgi:uncharacterized repeat protein (TIGR01451 family)
MPSRLLQQDNSIWNLGRRAIGVLLLPLGLTIGGHTLFTEVASANIGVNKSFNPITVTTNQKSKVTIELFNSNTINATGTNFTDSLPSGVTVASPANITNSCAGTVTALAGTSSISLAGGIIPATSSGNIGTCQIGVDVVSSTTGTFINTIPVNTVNSSQGLNPFKGEATLVVSPSAPITGSKTFAAANLHGGGNATTMTITLNNPNVYDLTGTSFTDTFPTGLKLATTPALTNTCGGTFTTSSTNKVTLAGGTIPAGGSCDLTVQVQPDVATSFQDAVVTNSIAANGGVTTTQGISNTSAIQGTVTIQRGAQITQSFAPTTIQPGQTSVLTLTLKNFNSTAITGANLTDSLPSNLTASSLVSSTCNGLTGTTTVNSGSIVLSGGTIPAAAPAIGFGSCTIQVNVTSTQSGTYTNSIAAGKFNTVNYAATTAAVTVAQASSVSMTKAFAATTGLQGNQSTLTLTLNNTSTSPANITSFTDDLLATMGTGFTVAASPAAATTCGGTINATAGSTSITKTDGSIPASGSCTITVPIAISATAPLATKTNTVPANGLHTDLGNNPTATTANLTVQSSVSLSKTFSPTTVTQGGQSTVTIALNNAGSTPATITSFTDDLTSMGTGITVAASPAPATTCGGTVTATAGSTSITKTNGVIPANGSCTVTVPIAIASTVTAGSKTNTIAIGALQTDKGNNSTAATKSLTVQSPITVSKVFAPTAGVQGGVSTLTMTLTNSSTAATNIASFLDSLTTMGTGFTVAASPAPSTTCGGTVTVNSGTEITKTTGTIPAKSGTKNGSCTITVPVAIAIDAAPGARTNTIPVGNVQTGLGNNETAATANFTVNSAVTLSKLFSPATVPIYGTSRLTINVNRAANAPALTGINLTDTFLPNSMTIGSSPNVVSDCGGSVSAIAGSNQISLTGGSLAGGTASSTCAISVNVRAPGSVGTNTNTIAANSLVTGQGATYNTAATANLTTTNRYIALNKSFSPTNITLGQTSKLTILILNNNLGAINLTSVGLTDLLPTGMSIAATPNPTFTGTGCTNGTITATPGTSNVLLSGAAISAGSTCKLEVDVTANFAGNLTNTLPIGTATSAENVTNSNNSVATLTLLGTSDLQVTKTNGTATVTAGGTSTYTIAVTNAGPNNVAGAVLTDNAPPGMTIDSWTCTTSVGSSCAAASGTGNLSANVSLLNQGTATFVVNAAIDATATGTMTNTATITAPATISDTTPANNSASDSDPVLPGHAKVVLVKRITAINNTNILTTVNDPTSTNDDSPKWPAPIDSFTGISSFLAGAINGGAVKSSDSVEYTIYFLANGAGDAQQLNLCDFIPRNSTYVNNSLFLAIGAGTPTPISDPVDPDGGFYPDLSTFPSSCSNGTDRGGGAVVVNVGTVNRSLGSGTPPSSFGFIRFRSTVN